MVRFCTASSSLVLYEDPIKEEIEQMSHEDRLKLVTWSSTNCVRSIIAGITAWTYRQRTSVTCVARVAIPLQIQEYLVPSSFSPSVLTWPFLMTGGLNHSSLRQNRCIEHIRALRSVNVFLSTVDIHTKVIECERVILPEKSTSSCLVLVWTSVFLRLPSSCRISSRSGHAVSGPFFLGFVFTGTSFFP